MYVYDEFDQTLLNERVAEFSEQIKRRMSGELTEEEFRPLRLMNGTYLQLHAYMLRISIPYGTLSAKKLRMLAHVARTYDRGYGHFTTRQNIQFHWIKLEQLPKAVADLASVGLHGMQTSGNCVRNISTDQWAGVARDEIADPRIYAEILRQHLTLHPEFSFLPRKFKIGITGAEHDRAAVKMHDIALWLKRGPNGDIGFQVAVGGGLGRTPYLAETIRDFCSREDLLGYVEAILRVYNQYGRRDNVWKARIKILVHDLGVEKFRDEVEREFAAAKDYAPVLDDTLVEEITERFTYPDFDKLEDNPAELRDALKNPDFKAWYLNCVAPHRVPGHAIVIISLKPVGVTGGDCTADRMEVIADLAEKYGYGEIRNGHEQNLCLPSVRQRDLYAVWRKMEPAGLALTNVDLITDIIACPGLDYCSLANARSIPIAMEITQRFRDLDLQRNIGRLHINISGCINACGHHHIGHIGILGVEKQGQEFYQITLGGKADENAKLGALIGPSVPFDKVADVVEDVVAAYIELRERPDEIFIDTVKRLGIQPFKDRVYAVR